MRKHVERVHRIIEENSARFVATPFREPLWAALRERVSSADKGIPWFMLPILTCHALGGDTEGAYHVAAGLEIGRIAAGCLDEWQDHDTEDALWQAIGPEQTVNLATGMIALSLLALTRLSALGVRPETILDLQREFQLTLLHMSEGQYMDLSDDLSLDDYETVSGAKSGALLRLGCRAGAMVAGAPAEALRHYGEFGYDLGILIQVWNDLYGVAGAEGKRDVEHQRALPVLAARAVEQGKFNPQSAGGQTGQLYAVFQVGLFHQRASDALAKCPAPGLLPRFLDEYSPSRLAEIIGQTLPQREANNAQQAV